MSSPLVQKEALDAGSATRTQLLSVQSQLASDRTLLPDFRQQEAVSRHALAILAGESAGKLDRAAIPAGRFSRCLPKFRPACPPN